MKKRAILSLCLCMFMLLWGCSRNQNESVTSSTSVTSVSTAQQTVVDASQMFTDRDMEIGYDAQTSAEITLNGSGATCTSDAVQISGSVITISDEGTYLLSGTLEDGMIIVNAQDTDKVQLVLNGVSINSASSAALYVLAADKVFVTTAPDSNNTLSNAGTYTAIDENNIDAVIFSKSDLTLNGSGVLNIQAAAGHGVVSKDDLVLTSGTYEITAASHGLSGKDSVRIANGTYSIVSGKDGIHAENADDSSLGFLYIAEGTFSVSAQGDGLSAAAYLQIENGNFTIHSGGGSANAAQQSTQEFAPPGMQQTADTEDSTSMKGLKAGTELKILKGTFLVDSADDALHSNGNVTIVGGDYTITTGDDGIHADSTVTISQGNIEIQESYEGIEGLRIQLTGGSITLTASDDGLNAAGGNDSSGLGGNFAGGRGEDQFSATEGASIDISGGTLSIDASGDGIDSNGDFLVSGGEIYVSGPTNSGNGILDYSGQGIISGGIFAAAGASGMNQNFSTSSTQGVLMVSVNNGAAGSTLTLRDEEGNFLISWQADKQYSCVMFSCPALVQGSSYLLSAGSETTEITMDRLIYGSDGGGMGGGMNGGNPGGGRR